MNRSKLNSKIGVDYRCLSPQQIFLKKLHDLNQESKVQFKKYDAGQFIFSQGQTENEKFLYVLKLGQVGIVNEKGQVLHVFQEENPLNFVEFKFKVDFLKSLKALSESYITTQSSKEYIKENQRSHYSNFERQVQYEQKYFPIKIFQSLKPYIFKEICLYLSQEIISKNQKLKIDPSF